MIKLCYDNLVDSATITASSAQASLPASNVAHFWKTKVWRATGCTAEWIKFDLGSAQNIKAVCIVGHNFTSGATVKIQANSIDSWTTPPVDITLTYNSRIILYVWDANQNYQWWRITIADASNPDGYVEIGRVFLGTFLEPHRNYVNYSKELIDPSIIGMAADGPESIDEKTPYNVFSFSFRNTKIDNVETVYRAVKMVDPFFIIADYNNNVEGDGRHELSAYVKFLQQLKYDYAYKDRKNFDIVLKEER